MHLLSFFICVIIVILFGKLLNYNDFAIKPQLLCLTMDAVQGGHYINFYVHFNSHIVLNLTSIYGDADIYVSDTDTFPSYDPESYSLFSATCGVDVIEMNELLKSPLAVSIYGYADFSYFSLEIYENLKHNFTGLRLASIGLESGSLDSKQKNDKNGGEPDKTMEKSNKQVIKKKHKSSANAASVFLEIMQLIFL